MLNTYSFLPYWQDDIGFVTSENQKQSLPDRTEVLIVGAGYTGLYAALTLSRAGKNVVVVDANQAGSGASSRNGGLLGPSFHKLGLEGLVKRFGRETANEIYPVSIIGKHQQRSEVGSDLYHGGTENPGNRGRHAICHLPF